MRNICLALILTLVPALALAQQQSAQGTFTLKVAPPALTITTTSLPAATVGVPYSAALAATGGTAPYTWTIVAGTLPPGLTLSPAGTISGTPTTANGAGAAITFKVTDSGT